MRTWPCFIVVGALAGCTGSVIDAGANDAGAASAAVSSTATTIASGIQSTPTDLASDGTSLFWVSSVGAGGPVSSVPVKGGMIKSVVPGMIGGGFFAVDDVNVYYVGQAGEIHRAPKSGAGSPTLVNEVGASIRGETVVGARAYWLEALAAGTIMLRAPVAVKSAPLHGGAVSVIAQFNSPDLAGGGFHLGVTTTTVFLFGAELWSFPLRSGVPDGGAPSAIPGATQTCENTVSDADAVYCDTGLSIVRFASDGTMTVLGSALAEGLVGSALALDDTYVYWVDAVTVGTIMRVPKTGGTATIIARDTSPVAIAVDANAVYWSDLGGNIMRLAK